jgi:hypothetical protein
MLSKVDIEPLGQTAVKRGHHDHQLISALHICGLPAVLSLCHCDGDRWM